MFAIAGLVVLVLFCLGFALLVFHRYLLGAFTSRTSNKGLGKQDSADLVWKIIPAFGFLAFRAYLYYFRSCDHYSDIESEIINLRKSGSGMQYCNS